MAGTFGIGLCCCHGSCTCSTKICVTGCPSGTEVVGALVTVETTGGETVGTCFTSDDGHGNACCSICLDGGGGAGTYNVTVSATGYTTFTGPVSLACNGTTTIELQPTGTAPCVVQFIVIGCCASPFVGATVTVGGVVLTTANHSGSIYAPWNPPGPGTYAVVVSACNFQNCSFNLVVSDDCGCTFTSSDCTGCCSLSGNQVTITLVPTSDYVCGFNGPYPTPMTLHLTDSVWGTCTLTYNAGTNTYNGSITGLMYPGENYGGGVTCPASTGFTLDYILSSTGSGSCGGTLGGACSADFCGDCVGGFFTWNAGLVPDDAVATIPCTNGNPVVGCVGGGCISTINNSFGSPLAVVCPMDAEWDFGTNPPCPGPSCCSNSGAVVNPASPCGIALWTNFGPGSIVVTE